MSESHTHNQHDRALEKALSNHLIDRYLSQADSCIRAILRMCYFSVIEVEGKPALIVECPNQAVAKRLICQTNALCHLLDNIIPDHKTGDRILLYYQDGSQKSWRYYDSKQATWKNCSKI